MIDPNDRELEEYLSGGSKLSARYREAGGESTPPALDEVILAQANAELRRKPSLNRYLAPVALAASVVLAVNLAWNLRQAEPLEDRAPLPTGAPAEADAVVAAAPAPEPKLKKAAPAAPPAAAPAPAPVPEPAPEPERREVESDAAQAMEAEPHALIAREVQAATRARMEERLAAPLTEAQKVDRLIAFVANLEGAVFIRNDRQHTPAEAARHLQLKREKAGDRVKTADDFIRLCASHSTLSGEAYLIRLKDGRTRTAEDVLREELTKINRVRVD